jgi:predicted RNase H-like HicB family nuclease
MTTRIYSLVIEEHEDGYLAYFPGLPGCNTSGATFAKAVENAKEAARHHLEILAEHGDPLPQEQPEAPLSPEVTGETCPIAA